MLYERQQAQKPMVENKVRLAPKIVKPGAVALDTKETRLSDLKQKFATPEARAALSKRCSLPKVV
jgi:hypothetical protein